MELVMFSQDFAVFRLTLKTQIRLRVACAVARVRCWRVSGPVALKLTFLSRNPAKIEFLTFSSRQTQEFPVKSHALNLTIAIHT
jgi:hypothetical protein